MIQHLTIKSAIEFYYFQLIAIHLRAEFYIGLVG